MKTQNIEKYRSRNPILKLLLKKFFKDLDCLIFEIKSDVKKALEIGCGEGIITKHIYDLGIDIVGADISDEMLEIAKKLHPEIPFIKMDIYELGENKYDLIVCCEVLEHLEEPEKAVIAMKKSAKYIILSVPNEPFFRIANILRLKYLRDLGNTPGHINHWTTFSFRTFLSQFEFKEIKFKISTLWQFALCRSNQ